MVHGPLRTTTPPTRVNDDLKLTSAYHNILNNHALSFLNKSQCHSLVDGNVNDQKTRFFAEFLKKSFVYVITETVAEYPYPYFSEKTWKAMVTGVPFMLIGSRRSLKKLHEFGFKTFDKWWDESYDDLPTAAERIDAVVTELKKLSKLEFDELTQLRFELSSVIKHNFNQVKIFKNNDIANVKKTI